MRISALIEKLASADEQQRLAASAALAEVGAAAIGPLLAVLCDKESPVDWGTSAWALRGIGDAAFGPLVDAIATAPTAEVARRAGWAFVGLKVSDKAMYVPALRHPSPKVRSDAAYVLQLMGADALPLAPAIVSLLTDPSEEVRQGAIWTFAAMGPDVAPLLREVRRSAARERRHALTALAELGGWGELDEVDQSLIQRLIRVKIPDEVPQPMHVCGSWFALPTSDQAAVLEAFGLRNAVPVTMRLGASAWHTDHHGDVGMAGPRVYVTPAIDGWTLVFGDPSDDAPVADASTGDHPGRYCAALSHRFGAAHWYYAFEGCAAWCIAEGGRVVRYYDNEQAYEPIGSPHPSEEGHHGGCYAWDVAAGTSVDPSGIGPHTRVVGHAVLALTGRDGRWDETAPGALPI